MIERMPRGDELGVHRAPRQRLERHRANELLRRAREHHVDFGARLRQQARQECRLVAGNPSRNAQEDPARVERANGITPAAGG